MSDLVLPRPANPDPITRFAEQQTWISPTVEQSLQTGIWSALDSIGGEPLRRFLHGDWLHVPLHAFLTDIPIGAWTATITFDALASLTPSPKLDAAADATNALGLAAATIVATTGLNDWSEIRKPEARRVGLIHGLLNITATGLFIASCVARRRRNRPSARALAALGYVIVAASAHLGGALVYQHGIGVANTSETSEVTPDLQE